MPGISWQKIGLYWLVFYILLIKTHQRWMLSWRWEDHLTYWIILLHCYIYWLSSLSFLSPSFPSPLSIILPSYPSSLPPLNNPTPSLKLSSDLFTVNTHMESVLNKICCNKNSSDLLTFSILLHSLFWTKSKLKQNLTHIYFQVSYTRHMSHKFVRCKNCPIAFPPI